VKKSWATAQLSCAILMIGLSTGCGERAPSDGDVVKQEGTPESAAKQEKWGNAADFTLPRLGGGYFTLSSLKGKVIILDFWATSCPPCRKEIPGFVELHETYKDEGLEIVGVCLESESNKVKAFAEDLGISYVLVFANRGVSQEYGGIRYIPTTFIIDRRGDVAKKHIGYVSKEVFEDEIKKLLSGKAD